MQVRKLPGFKSQHNRAIPLASALFLAWVGSTATSYADDDIRDQFNPVRTAVVSLGIAPDARAGGMGDVGAATDPDVHSQFWNPAKYPFTISRAGFALNYTPWLRKLTTGIALLNAAGYVRLGDYQALSASRACLLGCRPR